MTEKADRQRPSLYQRIIAGLFEARYRPGVDEVPFERTDITRTASALGVTPPANIGDLMYTYRYRRDLPESITALAPAGQSWIIQGTGAARYRFVAVPSELVNLKPTTIVAETKVPDATPGIVDRYALTDEQALLARLRYNRLIDIFTGLTSYSLQSHLRTQVRDLGQTETDELYVGVDRRGAHYVFPVQAKAGNDRLSIVQIDQDLNMCAARFPNLIRRPIGAQFTRDGLIAVFEFEVGGKGFPVVSNEKHYRLVPPAGVTDSDLQQYGVRSLE